MKLTSEATSIDSSHAGSGTVRLSVWMLVGVPAGIVFLTLWATFVKTSPTLGDEDRIRGWGTVVRELPATLFLIAIPLIGFALAVSGGRRGSENSSLRAIWLHGAALLFVLLVVLGGSTENIMTTRPSTIKWLLLPLEVGPAALGIFVSRRAVLNHR